MSLDITPRSPQYNVIFYHLDADCLLPETTAVGKETDVDLAPQGIKNE